MLLQFITIRLLDFVDIFLVAVLLYQFYRLIKGTVAMSIFICIVGLYFLWRMVDSLQMELLSGILGQVMGVGVLALIVVFQQEIRRFLIILGNRYFKRNKFFKLIKFLDVQEFEGEKSDRIEIVDALFAMAPTKTGALIVISIDNELPEIIRTGEQLDAALSSGLLQTIFFKNSPLHDGAVIVFRDRIIGARCQLPTTNRNDVPAKYGMRHRSAIGMSEETNTLVLTVSEETGDVSYVLDGEIKKANNKEELLSVIEKFIKKE